MDIKRRFKGRDLLSLIRELTYLILDPDNVYELIIRKYQECRSLRANNYSWALTDKLAEKMLVAGVKLSKMEMHAEMIYRYGQPEIKDGHTVIVTARSDIKLDDFYPYAKEVGSGEINGREYSSWRIYRGSHSYDKKEMSLFIKGIVEECREQGIETATPDEIARMISLMREVR